MGQCEVWVLEDGNFSDNWKRYSVVGWAFDQAGKWVLWLQSWQPGIGSVCVAGNVAGVVFDKIVDAGFDRMVGVVFGKMIDVAGNRVCSWVVAVGNDMVEVVGGL